MLKILQIRLQQYMSWELPGVQAGFRKGRGTRSNCNILWMIEKAMGSPSKKKTPSTSASLTTLKPLTVWITTKCGKFLKRWEYQTTCLLRNLYAGQEATVRTEHRRTDWFKIGKGVCQGSISSPCLFKLYAEYIMQNARLDEAQAGIKISGRNINNLRYADDTVLMAENEEELRASWWKWKRRVKELA